MKGCNTTSTEPEGKRLDSMRDIHHSSASSTHFPDESAQSWDAVLRTHHAVRNAIAPSNAPQHKIACYSWVKRWSVLAGLLAVAGATAMVSLPESTVHATPYTMQPSASSILISLTNQDRTSNGKPALAENATLDGIGGNVPHAICGITVDGRAADMIQREYFSHPIPPCDQYVFVIMQESGINTNLGAGENIGFVGFTSGPDPSYSPSDAATYINQQFMNSPEHYANIMGSYNQIGVGTAESSGSSTWTYSGGATYYSAWMFAVEFANVQAQSSTPPPSTPSPATPPPATPTPSTHVTQPTPIPSTTQHSTATPPPTTTVKLIPPVTIVISPTTSVSPSILPNSGTVLVLLPTPKESEDLLSGTIQGVIANYLAS